MNQFGKMLGSRGPLWALVLAFILLTLGYQNCGRGFKFQEDTASSNSASSNSEASINAFSATLHPVLRTNCGGCHGVSQAPQFAVIDVTQAHNTLVNNILVNLASPANSRIVLQIAGNHSNVPISVSAQLTTQIQAWNTAILGLPAEPIDPPGMPQSPVITSVTPSSIPANTVFTLVIRGNYFVAGSILVVQNTAGALLAESAVTFISTQEVHLPSAPTGAAAGTYIIRIRNPDGRLSGTATITVTP